MPGHPLATGAGTPAEAQGKGACEWVEGRGGWHDACVDPLATLRVTQGVDGEGFIRALRQLGFGAAPLTASEVAALVASCDADGNGRVDAREWRMRFAAAVERLQTNVLIQVPG